MGFVEHWREALGLAWYAAAREDGALLMADGHARWSGEVGLASVTAGPGVTNLATPLLEASRAHSPIVVLAGDVAASDIAAAHRFDLAGFAAACEAGHVSIASAAEAAALAGVSLRQARQQRRPQLLTIPADLAQAEAPRTAPRRVEDSEPEAAVDAGSIGAARDLLAAARRPLVLAGRGALAAADDVRALAEHAGALLATSLGARGLFDGEEFSIGACGGYATAVNRRLSQQADCVVAFGASLNPWTVDHGRAFPRAKIVRCDRSAAPPSAALPVALELRGDAGATARALSAALRERRAAWRTPDIAAEIAAYDPRSEFVDESDAGGLDPRSVVVELERALPSDRAVAVDLGVHTSEVARWLRARSPRDFVFSVNFGAVGLALGHAIGVAAGSGRLTVAVVGDGGFAMSLAELDTAVRHRLPLLVVVMNDGAYGAEYHHFVRRGWPDGLTRFQRPDYAQLARAAGADGVRIERLEEIPALADRLGVAHGPLVADVKLKLGVLPEWYSRLIGRST
jgi:acetolactate synthase I/II/III large subunit